MRRFRGIDQEVAPVVRAEVGLEQAVRLAAREGLKQDFALRDVPQRDPRIVRGVAVAVLDEDGDFRLFRILGFFDPFER